MSGLISNHYDLQLLQDGIDSFSTTEKNKFIVHIAQMKNIPITDINSDYLLAYHKELKIKEFSNICEQEILRGFVSTTNGHTYRTNRDDQFNMFVKYVMTKDNPNVLTIMFKAEDLGEQISHTKAEYESIVMEGYTHVESKLLKLDDLRKQIRSCTSDSAILSIIWP